MAGDLIICADVSILKHFLVFLRKKADGVRFVASRFTCWETIYLLGDHKKGSVGCPH